jgi:hypothetical protein
MGTAFENDSDTEHAQNDWKGFVMSGGKRTGDGPPLFKREKL